MNPDRALVRLSMAQHALAECKNIMDTKQVIAMAAAARVYLERTNASVETVNLAIEIRTLAERKMGEFLLAMPKNHGARGVGKSGVPQENPTLEEIGISKKKSTMTQKLAEVAAPEFQERVACLKASSEPPTATKILAMEPGMAPRRSPQQFDAGDWEKHTRTLLRIRMSAVPVRQRDFCAGILVKVAREFQSIETS